MVKQLKYVSRVRARIDKNFRRYVNKDLDSKGKTYFTNGKFGYQDTQSTYRVVKMMARHWGTDVKTAYRMYADWVATGKKPSIADAKITAKSGSNG